MMSRASDDMETRRRAYEECVSRYHLLRSISFERLMELASPEGVYGYDADRGSVFIDAMRLCARNGKGVRHDCVGRLEFGVAGDRFGLLSPVGGLDSNDKGESLLLGASAIVGAFIAVLRGYMRRAFAHRIDMELDRLNWERNRRANFGAAFDAFRDRYPLGVVADWRYDANEIWNVIKPAFPFIEGGDEKRYLDWSAWLTVFMGKRVARYIDSFSRVGLTVDKPLSIDAMQALEKSGNESVAMLGPLAIVDALDGGYSDEWRAFRDEAFEIPREGLNHPGQMVRACKLYLAMCAEIAGRGDSVEDLYRGLLNLPKAAVAESFMRVNDRMWIDKRARIRHMCVMARSAGESPVRAGVVRAACGEFIPRLDRAEKLKETLARSGAVMRRKGESAAQDLAEFFGLCWRLLARADRARADYASLRRDLKDLGAFVDLWMPAMDIQICDFRGKALPLASRTWTGLMKTVRGKMDRHRIAALERQRAVEESEGGVIRWEPAYYEPIVMGDVVIREISDSADMRILGAALHNCLGNRGYAVNCADGRRRLFAVRRIEESEDAGAFSLLIDMERGTIVDGDLAMKGRGRVLLTRSQCESARDYVIDDLRPLIRDCARTRVTEEEFARADAA